MSVKVRMAPSPTGFLHIGGVRTFLFNWLFARQQGGECLLRIENTDTSREVAEAVDQIQESLRWVGIDWDGPVTFQLDTAERARELAQELVTSGHAYEDDGAIRFRQPKEGTVSWVDAVRGEIEFRNELLPDLVIVRSDGRPTYNFISPVDDILDGITHVVRGQDHVSNTPSQINILRALGADLPVYAHVPDINGDDGKKLSKRAEGATVASLRDAGYPAEAVRAYLDELDLPKHDVHLDLDRIRSLSVDALAALDDRELAARVGVPAEAAALVRGAHDLVEARLLAATVLEPPSNSLLQAPSGGETLTRFAELRSPLPDVLGKDEAKALVRELKAVGGNLRALRLALTGHERGPELWAVLRALPRDEALRRALR